MKKATDNKKGAMALSQILILIIGIIAISWAIGGGLGKVKADDEIGAEVSVCQDNECPTICVGNAIYSTKCSNGDNQQGFCSEYVEGAKEIENCANTGKTCKNGQCTTEDVKSTVGDSWVEKTSRDIFNSVTTGVPTAILTEKGKKLLLKKSTEKGVSSVLGKTITKWVNPFSNFKRFSGAGGILHALVWAYAIYQGFYYLSKAVGFTGHQAQSIAYSMMGTYLASQILPFIFTTISTGPLILLSGATGLVILAITYKYEAYNYVTYQCQAWDAEKGGKNCGKCNDLKVPCDEYICKSLGQGCELINKEFSDGAVKKLCIWQDPNDIKPPVIKPWIEILTDGYKYNPDKTINPPDEGVKIISKTGSSCTQPFTFLTFGVTLNEAARCKISPFNERSFKNMSDIYLSSGAKLYNHSFSINWPNKAALENENLTAEYGSDNEFYVRCEDSNGNSNIANFIFKFCVDEFDETAPVIMATSLANPSPVQFNTSNVDLSIYVNEPSECKWSRQDKDYKDMEEQMTCAISITEMNAQMLYECSTSLTGIKNREDNNYYFRCKDQPLANESDRNTNHESFKFTLTGTEPLIINSITVNGEENGTTINDATTTVKSVLEVETSAGYKEGEALCYWSETGNDNDYILFFDTGTYLHKQELWLTNGTHTYFVKCIDLGGNSDTESISFTIETDTSAPIVVRIYHDSNYLKIITNEKAECIYSAESCDYYFEDGISMTTKDEIEHFTEWDTQTTLYIKCKDKYNNQPNYGECSIIARAFQVSESSN